MVESSTSQSLRYSRKWLFGLVAVVIAATAIVVLRHDGDDVVAPTLIPELDDPAAADCVVRYPEDLPERAIAFDGTLRERHPASDGRDIERGPDGREVAIPIQVTFDVNEVFKGGVGKVIVMRTWDFAPQAPDDDLTGQRYLVAAGVTRDLMMCGFTRPYSEQDAEYWRQTFGGGE